MKKLMSLLLTVLLLVSLSLPAFAQGESGKPQLVVSTVEAMPGDEVSVTITIRNNPGIGVINPKFVFDSDSLQWLGYEEGGLKGWTVTQKAGVWLGTADSDFNGVILTLRFKVLDTAQNGLAEVRLVCGDGDAYNYAEQLILFELVSGGVQIGSDAPSSSPSPSPSTSPSPAAGGAGGSASPSSAPQETPSAGSPAPEASENAALSEEAPAPAEGTGPSSAKAPAGPDGGAEAQAAAKEDSLSKTPGTTLLSVVLACCAILALVVILLCRARNKRKT